MKPFLILQLRPIDEACENEFNAFLKYGELKPEHAKRIRMEKSGIPEINLKDYSGIILGGGPSNVSDPIEIKPDFQIRFEKDLDGLLSEIIEQDFPFLGCCYGMGVLGKALNSIISKESYGEPAGGSDIELTDEGKLDAICEGVPESFRALVGHKEACQQLPSNAQLLATSKNCPIQMIRYKNNIYATQFHPEMDSNDLIFRINIYNNHGYFEPSELSELTDQIRKEDIKYPQLILRNFIKRYTT